MKWLWKGTEIVKIKQKEKQSFARFGLFVLVYFLVALVLYWVVKDNWSATTVKTDSVSMGYLLPAGSHIRQTIRADMDELESLEFVPHFDQQERTGYVSLALLEGETVVWTTDIPAIEMPTDQRFKVSITPCLKRSEEMLVLKISPNETNMALWAGNTVSAGKFDVAVRTSGMNVNGEDHEGCLVLSVQGRNMLQASRWFWPVAMLIFVLMICVVIMQHIQQKKGKNTILTMIVAVLNRYHYLLKQLVVRDFRVKYKSSALGMIWSLLNPLLTMLVYLFVFSTLFKSDVKNFPVYLMSGIVVFSYFSEATNLGMGSIVSNSALITKVYMPKLIYPLSKVLSSSINFCISLVPLFLVMLITGVTIHKSILLLPIAVAFLIVFSFGVSLILATMNVFFRDTQFLWSVLLTLLNFLTPIFYPENIIPAEFLAIYRCNPMNQIISFTRTIIIDGVSPTPESCFGCIVSCGVTLMIGLWVFRKNQDRFVLYL